MGARRSTLRLPALRERLQDVMAFIETSAEAAGVAPAKSAGLCLSVEEAFVNICEYASEGEPAQVELVCSVGSGTFVLEIMDTGREFNPLSVPKPDLDIPLEQRQIGGLGVHLIRNFTDEAEWRRDGGRNVLRLSIDPGEGDSRLQGAGGS